MTSNNYNDKTNELKKQQLREFLLENGISSELIDKIVEEYQEPIFGSYDTSSEPD